MSAAPGLEAGLSVTDLSVSFGGNQALQGVSLEAPLARITGLIGPNGAGKTTTFNACSGLLRPGSGRVEVLERNVSRWSPARRARLGLGRTFQRMELVRTMTVRTNVALGAECRAVGSSPLRQVFSTPGERGSIAEATEAAIALCDLSALADRPVGELSTGQCRLVELARVLAGGYSVLLLDEPSSGLDEEESTRFGRILERAVAERGVGILLVEHDMSLVMSICRHVYVLEFGRLIFDGDPEACQASEDVRAAYLGAEAVPSR